MTNEDEELSIADVLCHYGATRVPEGAGWKTMNCPFHHDRVASGRVNVSLNAYKCHGCSVSGDAIKIIEDQENVGYGEAVEFARSILGKGITNLPQSISGQKKRKPLGSDKWKDILA